MRSLFPSLLAAGALGLPALAFAQSAVTVEQIGEETLATITHKGANNGTRIIQEGSGLEADVSIDGVSNRSGGADNVIRQTGEGSTATVRIFGDGNDFRIEQSGARGPAGNSATLNVTGLNNSATISQVNDAGLPYANTATVQQTGNYNIALVSQRINPGFAGGSYGTSNSARIRQQGDENFAEIKQDGAGNDATIEQDGFGNSGKITQQGVGSSFYLSQTGNGHKYDMIQSGCLVDTCAPVEIYQGAGAGAPPGVR